MNAWLDKLAEDWLEKNVSQGEGRLSLNIWAVKIKRWCVIIGLICALLWYPFIFLLPEYNATEQIIYTVIVMYLAAMMVLTKRILKRHEEWQQKQ